ncbi:MAG: hypothetical protein AB7P69_17705 [Candidatus Binatia bacterium]
MREVVSILNAFLWSFFPFTQKDLAGPTNHIAALVLQLGVAFAHLIPDAAQRVVGKKLDDVAWSKELVAHGQLAAVARRRGLVAHLFPFGGVVVILIDPADGLILNPQRLQVGRVKELQQFQQRRFAGKE